MSIVSEKEQVGLFYLNSRSLLLISRCLFMAIGNEHCLEKGARKQNHHQAIRNEAIVGLFT
jgi:hypothetical protein